MHILPFEKFFCTLRLGKYSLNVSSRMFVIIHFSHLDKKSNWNLSCSDGKASVYNAGDLGLIPGSRRFPREGNGNPLQYSCLENPMDGGAWCRLLSMGSQRVGHD